MADNTQVAPVPLINSDVNNAINQWKEANERYEADYTYLMSMLQHMLELAKTGHVEEAFQIAQTNVMPSTMRVQGDTMGQLAAGMNIASALQESVTNAENNVTGGANITEAQAKQFVNSLKALYSEIQGELKLPADQQWMSSSTANSVLGAIGQICKTFSTPSNPSTNPSELNWVTVKQMIWKWNMFPTKAIIGGNGMTGQQNLQNMQAGITQATNSISSQSQGLQTQEQFAANVYNQYLGSEEKIFQSMQKQYQSFVQNQTR